MPILASDPRLGRGVPVDAVEQATHSIPPGCTCSWTVITPGPGMQCISRQSYGNALCPERRDHEKHRVAAEVSPFRPEVV